MKTNKRVLAWLVALCMIVAIIPAMPAEYASAADGDIVYDFVTGWVTSATYLSSGDGNKEGMSDFAKSLTFEYTASKGSAPWQIAGLRSSTGNNSNAYLQMHTAGLLAFANNGGRNSYCDIWLRIPEGMDGYYTVIPSLSFNPSYKSAWTESTGYTTAEATLYADKTATTKLGVISSTKPYYATDETPIATGYFAAGDYRFRLYAVTVNNTSNNAYLKKVTFRKANPEIAESVNVPTAMSAGESVTTKFAVSIGDTAMEGAAIASVASDSDAVVVNAAADGAYTITAAKTGKAAITVKATYGDGIAIEKKYNIVVRGKAPSAANPIYYYTGATNNSYALVRDSKSDANVLKAAQADVTYDSTAAAKSSPWRYFTSYISNSTSSDNTISMDSEGIAVTSNGTGIVAYVSAQLPQAGWYTIDTDYDVTYPDQKASFSFYLHDASNGSISTRMIRFDGTAGDLYDVNKAVYLSNSKDICMLYSLESSNLPKDTINKLTVRSTALNAATPNLEAASDVKTAYVLGDEAETVGFTVGAMAPSNVTAVSDSAAVTASVSGADVTFTPAAVGTAKVTVTATYGDTTVSKVYTINVTKPQDAIGANFGNTYAFIREVNDGRNTTYKLVLVGAIDSLNYEEVGFKAYNESICAMLGVDVIKLGTKQVYNKINVGGNEFTAEDFGLNSGYIFTAEYDVPSVAAAMSVDFWAYATTADDEIEGGKRVIPSLAK